MAQNVLLEALERLEREMSVAAMWAIAARPAAWKTYPDSDRAAVFAKEPVIRGAISQSCEEWVESGHWPVMNPEDAFYVWERVWRGHRFCQWLLRSGLASPDKTANQMLVWLLVDGWVNVLRFEWKEDLFAN